MKVPERVKDALKRKSKGQNVMVGLAGAISVVIAIIIVYNIIRSSIPPNTPFTTAMNYTFLLLIVAIVALLLIVFLLMRRL